MLYTNTAVLEEGSKIHSKATTIKLIVKRKCVYTIMLQEQKVTYPYGQVSEAAMGMPAAQSFVSILQMT